MSKKCKSAGRLTLRFTIRALLAVSTAAALSSCISFPASTTSTTTTTTTTTKSESPNNSGGNWQPDSGYNPGPAIYPTAGPQVTSPSTDFKTVPFPPPTTDLETIVEPWPTDEVLPDSGPDFELTN